MRSAAPFVVGLIHRIRQGAYVFGDQWTQLDASEQHLLRAMAVLRTARTKVVLSHTTALIKMGAPSGTYPWTMSM